MRHILIAAASCAIAMTVLPLAAQGQPAYPVKNIRVIVQKLNAEIGTALALPDIRRRFADMGLVTKHSTPEAFGQFLISEIARWRARLAKKP